MKLNLAICDDDIHFIRELRNLLTTLSFDMNIELQIEAFSEGKELLSTITASERFPYQILFMDIEMPEENGIDLAKVLYRQIPSDSFLVFISSYPEYMQDSFSVHPFSYLTKPIHIQDIKKVLVDIQDRYNADHIQLILTEKDGYEAIVFTKDVIYIQVKNSRQRIIMVHTLDNEYIYHGSLTELEQKFPDTMFRLDRKTLINLSYIHYLDGNQVIMTTGTVLSISIRNKRQLLHLLQRTPSNAR